MKCPCGLDNDFSKCCQPFLKGEQFPASAEALMRSRYSAYTESNVDYIVSTHDQKTRDDVDRDGAQSWADNATWLGLDIVRTEDGGKNDEQGMVEFVARYQVGPNALSHHEISSFKKEEGRWFYVDGEIVRPQPVTRSTPKVGRNEKCPCGSGAKFKKCCGKAA